MCKFNPKTNESHEFPLPTGYSQNKSQLMDMDPTIVRPREFDSRAQRPMTEEAREKSNAAMLAVFAENPFLRSMRSGA